MKFRTRIKSYGKNYHTNSRNPRTICVRTKEPFNVLRLYRSSFNFDSKWMYKITDKKEQTTKQTKANGISKTNLHRANATEINFVALISPAKLICTSPNLKHENGSCEKKKAGRKSKFGKQEQGQREDGRRSFCMAIAGTVKLIKIRTGESSRLFYTILQAPVYCRERFSLGRNERDRAGAADNF